MKPATIVAIVFIALISLGHFLRLVFQVEVVAGGVVIPIWLSAIAFLFTGGLSVMLWMENRCK